MATRRRYKNPPVHEIVIDLQFEGELPTEVVAGLSTRLQAHLGTAAPIQRIVQQTTLRRSGIAVHRAPEPSLWGWEFDQTEPHRLTTVAANQLTQHFLRSESWPHGEYVGWEKQSEAFAILLDLARSAYSGLPIRRAGIRYVNRMALPNAVALRDWFTVVPPPLPEFDGLWDLTVSRTWSGAREYPGLSGTVSLSKIEAPTDVEETLGFVLDIDIFNLYVKDAPDLEQVPGWIEKAHELENRVFEHCITGRLAALFEPLSENPDA